MHRVGIVAGKGGVGKSVIAVSLAACFKDSAVLDLDLTMPSVQAFVKGDVKLEHEKFQPVEKDQVQYFSLGYLVDDPLTWNSEKIQKLVSELFTAVEWRDDTEYLFIDSPPGTDSVFQSIIPYYDTTIIVTNPSLPSLVDAKRLLRLLRDEEVPVSGEIRNMSFFICPKCGCRHEIFNSNELPELKIPLLAEIPLVKLVNNLIPADYIPDDKIKDAIMHPIKLKKKKTPYILKKIVEKIAR